MSVCRICDLNYTRNSEVQFLLNEREETLKLELKLQEQELRSQPCSPAAASAPTFAPSRPDDLEEELAATYSSMSRPETIASSSRSPLSSLPRFTNMNLISIPESSTHAHAYTRVLSTPASVPISGASFDLNATDVQANMAMVSDGSRYSSGVQPDNNSQLPPYSPGNMRTMTGHGNETNNIRLSEYVKGETRAQDMKDSGGF